MSKAAHERQQGVVETVVNLTKPTFYLGKKREKSNLGLTVKVSVGLCFFLGGPWVDRTSFLLIQVAGKTQSLQIPLLKPFSASQKPPAFLSSWPPSSPIFRVGDGESSSSHALSVSCLSHHHTSPVSSFASQIPL